MEWSEWTLCLSFSLRVHAIANAFVYFMWSLLWMMWFVPSWQHSVPLIFPMKTHFPSLSIFIRHGVIVDVEYERHLLPYTHVFLCSLNSQDTCYNYRVSRMGETARKNKCTKEMGEIRHNKRIWKFNIENKPIFLMRLKCISCPMKIISQDSKK